MYLNEKIFKERLVELRNELNLSQKCLAKLINVSRGAVSNWENGSRMPSWGIINQLAKTLNCTTGYLLGLNEFKDFNLNEKNVLFYDLFYNTSTPLYLNNYNKEGEFQFIDVNDAALKVLDYTREEFLGLNPRMLYERVYRNIIPVKMNELEAKQKLCVGWVHVTKHGRKIPVELVIHKFIINGEKIYLTVADYFSS